MNGWWWAALGYVVGGWLLVEFCLWAHKRSNLPYERRAIAWVFAIWPVALIGALWKKYKTRRRS